MNYNKLNSFEKFSADNSTDGSIKCYACAGEWPTRNCYPLHDSSECGDETFSTYSECADYCGTNSNQPVANDNNDNNDNNNAASSQNTYISNETLNSKINKALNNKLGKHPYFRSNHTAGRIFDYLRGMYNKYVESLPYDVPSSFSFGIFLIIVLTLTVCNIVLTIYGSKSIGACANNKVSLTIFIILFLMFSWVGNILPYYGNVAALLSMVVTTSLVIIGTVTC